MWHNLLYVNRCDMLLSLPSVWARLPYVLSVLLEKMSVDIHATPDPICHCLFSRSCASCSTDTVVFPQFVLLNCEFSSTPILDETSCKISLISIFPFLQVFNYSFIIAYTYFTNNPMSSTVNDDATNYVTHMIFIINV